MSLLTYDPDIHAAIERERDRQLKTLELIASENIVSPEVMEAMEAMGTVLTNKYAEGYPGKRYYGGCGHVDEAEILAIERAKSLFGAAYANVQPHSGAQANTAVLFHLLKPGDKLMGMNLSRAGISPMAVRSAYRANGSASSPTGSTNRLIGSTTIR